METLLISHFHRQPKQRCTILSSKLMCDILNILQVVEVEAEPQNTAVEDSRRELALSVWATADYARYTCLTREMKFSDTLLYQTRVCRFPLTNTGQIVLSYSWSIVRMDGSPFTPHSSQLQLDKTTGSVAGEGGEVVPFSISLASGHIMPGKDAVFTVSFAPLDVRQWECKLVCRYKTYPPNTLSAYTSLSSHVKFLLLWHSMSHLDSSSEPLEVVVSGRALMPYCHFELEPSNYSPVQQNGAERDLLNTQAVEFHSSGIGMKIVKYVQQSTHFLCDKVFY